MAKEGFGIQEGDRNLMRLKRSWRGEIVVGKEDYVREKKKNILFGKEKESTSKAQMWDAAGSLGSSHKRSLAEVMKAVR